MSWHVKSIEVQTVLVPGKLVLYFYRSSEAYQSYKYFFMTDISVLCSHKIKSIAKTSLNYINNFELFFHGLANLSLLENCNRVLESACN